MSDQVSVAGALLLPVLLSGLAAVAAAASAGVAAVASGRRVTTSELVGPVREGLRLLLVRRRTTLYPDALQIGRAHV